MGSNWSLFFPDTITCWAARGRAVDDGDAENRGGRLLQRHRIGARRGSSVSDGRRDMSGHGPSSRKKGACRGDQAVVAVLAKGRSPARSIIADALG